MNTAYNNNVSGERTIGGARSIFSNVGIVTLPSGFNVALTDVPDIRDGYIPAGTPMQVDEGARTAKIFKSAKVFTATDQTTGSLTIDIEKELDAEYGRNPFKVGDIIMVLGADLATAGLGVTITAIDRTTNTTKDVLTVNDEIIAAKGAFLVLASEESAAAAVPAVVPNCITPYDIVKDPYSTGISAEACFNLLNGVVYERRIPAIPNAVKVSLRESDCNFRFSQSK